MDLTFQVPRQYCSLQHWALLPSPATSTTGFCFCFGSISSFFLELFLHFYPVAYWAPINLGHSSFSIILFVLSYCSWGSQGKNNEVVCHSLLQWTTFCQNSLPKEKRKKGEKERYIYLNAEFQRIARDKKDFLSDQCKEIETKVE